MSELVRKKKIKLEVKDKRTKSSKLSAWDKTRRKLHQSVILQHLALNLML
jgi:hypothetical protein